MQRLEWMLVATVTAALSLVSAGTAVAQPECQARIGDFVYEDVNGNGIQDGPDAGIDGVTLTLSDEMGNLLQSTVSVDGSYAFEGLCEQIYIVDVDDSTLPAGFVPTIGGGIGDPEQDSDTAPVVVSVAGPTAIDDSIDFGYVFSESGCTGFIGDFVFEDANGNGVQDGPDDSIAGVRVVLEDAEGNVQESISNGGYGFSGLCAGDYVVSIDESTLPAGFVPTASNVGGDDTMDSDGSPVLVTLADDGAVDPSVDFGFKFQENECGMTLDARALPEVIVERGPFDWICGDGHLVFYRYELNNSGPNVRRIGLLDDRLGWVGYVRSLATDATRVRWWASCVFETTVSQVTATGTIADTDQACSASDSVMVTVDVPDGGNSGGGRCNDCGDDDDGDDDDDDDDGDDDDDD